MKQADSKQIQRIHAILAKIGMIKDKEYKERLVGQYSNWRVSSTKGLYYEEAEQMINDLQKTTNWTPEEVKANDKRRLILFYAHEMMWELPVPNGKPKVDMERVDNWCKEYGYLHKPLMKYTLEELSKLVWQIEQAHKAFLKSV